MNEPLILEGIAISIDICDSTNKFARFSDYVPYKVISKLARLIDYSINNSRCKLVRYTGDGALLFYPVDIGFSATNAAIVFSIGLVNNWNRCGYWFSELRDYKIRISLDEGTVYTNKDGGLWNGTALNIASKMKNKDDKEIDKNRVIISQNVFERIEKDSIYKNLFECKGNLNLYNGEDKDIELYYLCFKNEELKKHSITSPTVKIAVCILAVNTSLKTLQCVLSSIENQTRHPEVVVIATSQNNIENCISSLNIRYINIDKLDSKERSYVRNIITKEIEDIDVDNICFLDGDTILAPNQYPKEGWQTEWIKYNNEEIHFDFTSCIYIETTQRYNCLELCPLFCANDDITLAGYSPNIIFERSGTLGRGQDKCDFHFINGNYRK